MLRLEQSQPRHRRGPKSHRRPQVDAATALRRAGSRCIPNSAPP